MAAAAILEVLGAVSYSFGMPHSVQAQDSWGWVLDAVEKNDKPTEVGMVKEEASQKDVRDELWRL